MSGKKKEGHIKTQRNLGGQGTVPGHPGPGKKSKRKGAEGGQATYLCSSFRM